MHTDTISHEHQMIGAHPSGPAFDEDALHAWLHACLECAATCNTCADPCSAEQDPKVLVRCACTRLFGRKAKA